MAEVGNSKYDPSGLKKSRKSNFSPEEVDALVSTVVKNYYVLYGEFAKCAINKEARHKVWMDVTRQVNRVSIEKRTLEEVKNKWKKCQHLYKEREFLDDFDSMPLEQRLKVIPEQEPVLQSQPLSPTKLKVTRQSTKPPQPSPKITPVEPPNEEVCLRWNSHHSNMQSSFPSLLLREQYVDATLVAEGRSLKCHRLILSSCSPYFEEVLNGISPFQHPVLFMKDIPFWVLKSLCDFMYAGEVHIFQNKLEELLAVAEHLKIKGLAGKTEGSHEEVKSTETVKPVKEEKKEEKEKEVKEKRRSHHHVETPPKISSKPPRSVHPSRKQEKANKESLNKQDILDPLDLLEPVYEEVTKGSAPPKLKEVKAVPMKKGKLKKRKISEEREESPPPLFLSRKGTRSRPNRKIPKYYHTHYERVPDAATIVREPHTDQADPFFEIDEIKAEPFDMDDDVIEIQDNVIGFPNVPDIPPHDEEIIGNYDSPLVNLNDSVDPGPFKKINLVAQPIILNVHSIAEKSANSVHLIDLGQLKEVSEKIDDPLATISDMESDKVAEDPLNFDGSSAVKAAGGITITNVQSMAGLEETEMEKNKEAGTSDIQTEDAAGEAGGADNIVMEKESEDSVTMSVVSGSGKKTENVDGKSEVIQGDLAGRTVDGSEGENIDGKTGETEEHLSNITTDLNERENIDGKLGETGTMEGNELEKIDGTLLGTEDYSLNITSEENVTENVGEKIGDTENAEEKLGDTENVDEKMRDTENIDEKMGDVENVEEELGDTENIDEETGHTENVKEQMGDTENLDNETVDAENVDEKMGDAESFDEEMGDMIENTSEERGDTENVIEKLGDTESVDEKLGDPREISHMETTEDKIEQNEVPESENDTGAPSTSVSNVLNDENRIEKMLLDEPDEETEMESETPLGFHIAKVASEFTIDDDVDSAAVGESRGDESGFQITNVVSGPEASSDVDTPLEGAVGDSGTFSNHLADLDSRSARGDSLSEETQFLAESLEKLLDE